MFEISCLPDVAHVSFCFIILAVNMPGISLVVKFAEGAKIYFYPKNVTTMQKDAEDYSSKSLNTA